LKGAKEAERILRILDVRSRLLSTNEQVDVFDALAWLDVVVVFRPLFGLLGAYMRGDEPGVLISTRRQLSVQRFTAAHELGHAILRHEPSLDSADVLRRAANDQSGPKIAGFASYLQEIEADAFAGSLLLPVWLLTHHAKKQGWSRSSLTSEDVVYQLSLRCGASFQATAWALERNGLIAANARSRLIELKPKAIKARLGHMEPVVKTRSDAWNLTRGDANANIPVALGDTVNVTLLQQAGSGYLWRLTGTPPNQLSEIDVAVGVDRAAIGGPSARRILFRADASGRAVIVFEHKRPWESDPIDRVSFKLDVTEPEHGLSRANRARLMSRQQRVSHAT
jgi:Zn-dependent peptidase ImmA (M78 family)